ncbi:DNA primase [Legionella spiritensis]|uniref:DNA primase n=1 Tax=Legionella spiritensis TaxID=452 RepID=UPI000F71C4A5|nr:DNA primase [Legionella spiritensis]VEG92168.1 DNA primase DnaG [Legionella spiritensis]
MTGLIPQSFINELLSRTDLVELIDSYLPLKKQGNSYVACCPFHNEKTPSFNVVAKKQFYHCFGCGASGNSISFVMNYLSQNFIEAVETLAARAGLQVPRDGHSEKNQQSLTLYQLMDNVCRFYQQTLKSDHEQAVPYLRQRGLTGEVAKKFQLGFAPPGWHTLENRFRANHADLVTTGMLVRKDDGQTYDRYRQRIMFPIHDRHGRIIGFGGRAIDSSQKPKYLNSPETIIFQKNRELYGLHQVLQANPNPQAILVVEGYMDVIALAQHGFSNVVATLGTATSTYHIQLLGKHTQRLIFCFDGDLAGRQAAWRALENTLPQLNSGLDANFIFLPEGYDPDSLVREEGTEQFQTRLQQAIPLTQFFFDTLGKDIDTRRSAGKTQLIHSAKPYMQNIPEGPGKQILIDELSRMTLIESHRLSRMLADKTEPDADNRQKTISRSPIRLAIALLIQHPDIYRNCELQNKNITLDGDGQEVLRQLLHQVRSQPDINTATLVELWRNTELFESLNKLAGWDHQVPEKDLAGEFIDILEFLQKQNLENKINQYIAKSRKQGLTISERMLLRDMLKQRMIKIKP